MDTERENHSFAIGIPARILEIAAMNAAKTKPNIKD